MSSSTVSTLPTARTQDRETTAIAKDEKKKAPTPRTVAEVASLARSYTGLAIRSLANLALSAKNENARVKAISELIRIGWGESIKKVDLNITAAQAQELTEEQLREIVSTQIVDAEFAEALADEEDPT